MNTTRYIPQIAITLFLVLMLFGAWHVQIPLSWIVNDSLVRLAMNGVLVLSMVPMLNSGVGINFGLPVAIVAGLLGMSLAVNFRYTGLSGLLVAMLISVCIAIVFGFFYGKILNRVKGKEEITATFIGFSFIPLMNFFWATAPFSNRAMLWPIGGNGMRPTIGLKSYFAKSLNTLWSFNIGKVVIPLGLLLFFGLCCLLVALFFRSRTGKAMQAVGENEEFARLAGLNVVNLRLLAVILSTVIGAIGICVYAQSYGFLELYDAPLMMAFPAASAILVGGCSNGRTTIIHVMLGTFLFHTTYVLSGPLANDLLVPEVAEILRMIITNGVILYALLYRGGRHAKAHTAV
ncbi:ABC transporter permease subunit [Desulfosediminicola flagellatus]|uniref:ABC transporter permease subunit n=1 Tax=Desulfosediminicola flagellatus TaxID=2569541 RepID=UPI0010AD4635|nr:ABC transporter permease [Desulfosediminicola flagellatus]